MDPSIAALWREAAADARYENQARRERVLAHPDLAKKLTKPPLNFATPEHWTGYIPPRFEPEEGCNYLGCGRIVNSDSCQHHHHRARANDHPQRKVLVELSAEAWRRETTPALDEVPTTEPVAIEQAAG